MDLHPTAAGHCGAYDHVHAYRDGRAPLTTSRSRGRPSRLYATGTSREGYRYALVADECLAPKSALGTYHNFAGVLNRHALGMSTFPGTWVCQFEGNFSDPW